MYSNKCIYKSIQRKYTNNSIIIFFICLQELKPFQLAFGTPGGSEIMSSVDAFMRDVGPGRLD